MPTVGYFGQKVCSSVVLETVCVLLGRRQVTMSQVTICVCVYIYICIYSKPRTAWQTGVKSPYVCVCTYHMYYYYYPPQMGQ